MMGLFEMGLFDLLDKAIAAELEVSIETYERVIEDLCTQEEATFIINTILEQGDNVDEAKVLFKSKLN